MNTFYLILFLMASVNSNIVHDVHISKAEVHYKSESKSIQIALHIFLDDLEAELEKLGAKDPRLATDKESEDGEAYLMQYINNHFLIQQKDEVLKLEMIGKEHSEDLLAVWCYLEIKEVELQDLHIDNTVMLSRFDDQKNIVSFKVDGKRKAFFIMDHKDSREKLI